MIAREAESPHPVGKRFARDRTEAVLLAALIGVTLAHAVLAGLAIRLMVQGW